MEGYKGFIGRCKKSLDGHHHHPPSDLSDRLATACIIWLWRWKQHRYPPKYCMMSQSIKSPNSWLQDGWLRGQILCPGRGKIFLPCELHRFWGSPSLLSKGYCGLSPKMKRRGREADHSPPSSASVKNTCIYTILHHSVALCRSDFCILFPSISSFSCCSLSFSLFQITSLKPKPQ
jgi:hypothetical protein